MKAKFLVVMEAGPTAPDEHPGLTKDGDKRFWKVGAEIDHPDAYKLVHGGICEAIDDECRERAARMNQTQSGKLREVHERIQEEFSEFQAEIEATEADEE